MCQKMQGYFVETLKGRMAYLRKPDGQKRGKGKGTPSPVAVQRKPLMPLCQSLSPVALVCEDKASHEQHLKALKKEYKFLHPNKQVYSVTIFLLWQLHALVHTSIVYIQHISMHTASIPGTHVYHALLYV